MIPFLSILLGLVPPLPAGTPPATLAIATVGPDATPTAAIRSPARLSPVDTSAAPDRWFAEDKLKHFFMSFAATSLAYGGVRAVGLDDGSGLAVAGGAGVALGVGKEWHDRVGGGPFSVRDLAWDAAGVVVALVLAAQTR